MKCFNEMIDIATLMTYTTIRKCYSFPTDLYLMYVGLWLLLFRTPCEIDSSYLTGFDKTYLQKLQLMLSCSCCSCLFIIYFFGNRKAFMGKNEKNRALGYSGFFSSPTHSPPPPPHPPPSPGRVSLHSGPFSLSLSLSG